MHVRDARPEDAVPVFALHVAATRRLPRTHYTDEQVRDWADKRGEGPERYDTDELLVADRAGDVAGFGQWDGPAESGDETAELLACYVHPDHGGEGVGSALVDRMHAEMRDAGYERAELTASLNAVAFYERHGYDRVERLELEPVDVTIPVVRMARDL